METKTRINDQQERAAIRAAEARRCPTRVERIERAAGPVVIDNCQQHRLPTGYVTVTAPAGYCDRDLADAAGYCGRHFGFTVTRYEDGTATVALWND